MQVNNPWAVTSDNNVGYVSYLGCLNQGETNKAYPVNTLELFPTKKTVQTVSTIGINLGMGRFYGDYYLIGGNMKRLLIGLVVLLLLSCATPTGDGDTLHRGFDWALAIAYPVADEWSPDTVIERLAASGLDRSGRLTWDHYRPPLWEFSFYNGSQILEVEVDYNGDIEVLSPFYVGELPVLPDLDADDLAGWLAIALDIFDAHLGDGEYTYALGIRWGYPYHPDLCICLVGCCDDNGSLGGVLIDTATGEILDQWWD